MGRTKGAGQNGSNSRSRNAYEYKAMLNYLREQRHAKGITMRDIGAKLNVPHSYVAKVENADRNLSALEMVELCEAIGVNPHDALNVMIEARNNQY